MLTFRDRFMAAEAIFGSFVKTPTTHAIEIFGALGFDFVVIDEEHSPFDRAAIDVALVAARAARIPALVRIADSAPSRILSALDCGAAGILAPHVTDVAGARGLAAAARFSGARGYSGATRAAGFGGGGGRGFTSATDAQIIVIAQIEDTAGVDNAAAIAGVEGIDGLFVGRGDLAVALGASDSDAPQVMEAAKLIAAAARAARKPAAAFAASIAEAASLQRLGVTMVIAGSDQSFLRRGATLELAALRAAAQVELKSQ